MTAFWQVAYEMRYYLTLLAVVTVGMCYAASLIDKARGGDDS